MHIASFFTSICLIWYDKVKMENGNAYYHINSIFRHTDGGTADEMDIRLHWRRI